MSSISDSPRPFRRRLPRAQLACQQCRIKKARCDQQEPCSNCQSRPSACIYPLKRDNRPSSQNKRIERQFEDSISPKDSRGLGSQNPAEIRQQDSLGEAARNCDQTPESMSHNSQPSLDRIPQASQGNENIAFEERDDGLPLPSDPDTVGDINKHTSGTEFYGTSSNFVLLNQLFSYAQLHTLETPRNVEKPGFSQASERDGAVTAQNQLVTGVMGRANSTSAATSPSHLGAGPLSVVNLLYNEEAMLPPSRPKTPVVAYRSEPASRTRAGASQLSLSVENQGLQGNTLASILQDHASAAGMKKQPQKPLAPVSLEKEYIRLFFNNLHHLHPMLLIDDFVKRCEDEIWSRSLTSEPGQDARHFFALYNIVIAVGSLVAGTEKIVLSDDQTGEAGGQPPNAQQTRTSPKALSRRYFRKSKALLDDLFKASSLESAQTLFLMSLYCQNSLMPHNCYMYSGMAVRTALAIGLPSESRSKSLAARKAARRTWWCIYSHEIDMSCSSGRRDSLRKPQSYLIQLPHIKDQDPKFTECEEKEVAMINEMVNFAAILRRISKEIYHDSKGLSILEKSARALEIDKSLEIWRLALPEWLNLDTVTFREPEWASKQKLVLQLRYLNTRILLHRPFLASVASQNREQLGVNIETCLEAARKTINLFYESYTHKPYFRTWWYNSTYTLYAGMIILYVILLDYTNIPGEELLKDVEKSHEILRAMEEASVAQRSADLMLEVTEVARRFIAQRQRVLPEQPSPSTVQHFQNQHQPPYEQYPNSGGPGIPELPLDLNDEWSRAFFPRQLSGDMLMSLIDPNTLQGFATDSGGFVPGAYARYDMVGPPISADVWRAG